jgi:hypothetical protein
MIRPPSGRMGTITGDERGKLIKNSPVYVQYDETVDRESAYEKLQKKASERTEAKEREQQQKEAAKAARAAPRQRESATDRMFKNMAGSVGRSIGSALVRGILGGLIRR